MPEVSSLEVRSRSALEADIPFLLELWNGVMSPHFRAQGISASDEDPLRRIRNRFECGMILSVDGRDVGFMKVARDGSEWHLIQILLSAEMQRKGVGKLLITNLVAEARAVGASLRLSVLKQNPAKALYSRLGFRIVGEERHAFEMQLSG